MYASGSSAAVKDPLETGSLDGRRFEIPPEIDVKYKGLQKFFILDLEIYV